MGSLTMTLFIVRELIFYIESEESSMRETIMKKNYAKAFKTVILLAVALAVVTAVAIPLSLSQQISDLSSLEQTKQEQTVNQNGVRDEHHDREEAWKGRITPLSAVNYAVIGGAAVLWLALGLYYWLLVVAWLYRSAVNEGMNKSLWPILGLFTNLLAVFIFMIVRDDPRRAKAANA